MLSLQQNAGNEVEIECLKIADSRDRTVDPIITNDVLYQLS